MHASTEQLLTIRDEGLLDATMSRHVEQCADCGERLGQLRDMRAALQALPDFEAPSGLWSQIGNSLNRPSRPHRWWPAAVAAAATVLLTIALWRPVGQSVPEIPMAEVVPDTANGAIVVAGAPQLDDLVSRSRRLEQVLRQLDKSTPRAMTANTAGTIAGLQDGIAYIDYGLSRDEQLSRAQSERLWRQRVGLMNTLVQVQGAQLQQVSAERR